MKLSDKLAIELKSRLRRHRVSGRSYAKVFCIGNPKTATTSLGIALRLLGFRHKSWDPRLWELYTAGDYDAIFRIAERYDSFDDGPWNAPDLCTGEGPDFYKMCDQRFLGSRFILTVRELKSWRRSHEKHFSSRGLGRIDERYQIDGYAGHREAITERALTRNEAIKTYFADRPGQLQVMDVCGGDGWEKLCSFLDLPIPDMPFPMFNVSTAKR